MRVYVVYTFVDVGRCVYITIFLTRSRITFVGAHTHARLPHTVGVLRVDLLRLPFDLIVDLLHPVVTVVAFDWLRVAARFTLHALPVYIWIVTLDLVYRI